MKNYKDIARLQTSSESVEIKPLIEIVFRRGSGEEKDPVRFVKQYWDLNGNLLFEKDEY